MEWITSLAQLDPQLVIQVIIQGGLAVTVIGLIWLNASSNKRYFNHTGDVIQSNTEAIIKNASSSQKLADTIDKVSDNMDRLNVSVATIILKEYNKKNK